MALIHIVEFANVAVTAQQDLFAILAAASRPCRLVAIYLSQTNRLGDAQSEGLSIQVKTGAAALGSGGSVATPSPRRAGDAGPAFTAHVNDTVKCSGGSKVIQHPDTWLLPPGYLAYWPPELRHRIAGGGLLSVELATTPAESITMSGACYVEEAGVGEVMA